MARSNITELTDEQVITASTDRFFRRVGAISGDIPATYAGKYVVAAIITIDTALSEAEMDTLETNIDAITGVHKSFVMIGPARVPIDRVPTGDELQAVIEVGWNIYTPEV